MLINTNLYVPFRILKLSIISQLKENVALYYNPNRWKNASPVRQGVMERCAGTWERFTEMFDSTPPGNNGYIGICET